MTLRCVRWISIPSSQDSRGVLNVLEGATLSFPIKRIFYMHQVPPNTERGGHAHPHTDQVVIPVVGEFRIEVSDGSCSETFVLNDSGRGLYLPRLTWTRLFGFSADCVALALCSTEYAPSDVIRDWNLFAHRISSASPASAPMMTTDNDVETRVRR
jgi:dTDP-4-dehydrorhamnose 3,5-epimerase-like enzyme